MSGHKYKYEIGDRVTIEGAGSEVFTVMARWTDLATFRNYYEVADWTGARRTGIGEDMLAPAPEAHRFEIGDPVTLAGSDHKWTVVDVVGEMGKFDCKLQRDGDDGYCYWVWAPESSITLDTDAINDGHADMVNHPPHYTSDPSGVECIQVAEHRNFCIGNAMKYLWRCDDKGSAIEDLEKAVWYIQREIGRRKQP